MTEDELSHNGVKGMRWGRRSGGNTSDSPAETSKKKSFGGPNVSVAVQRKILNSRKPKTEKKTAAKIDVKSMSDAELKAKVSRLQLERQYTQLSTPEGKASVSKGKTLAKEILADTGKNAVKEVAKKYAVKGLEIGIKTAFEAAKK